jgi:hypothetical protein
VANWDDLSDKPTVLTPPGFSAGNFPSAETLAEADIATALSHSPGLSDGIQTSIRASGSATDDALATEQAIREVTPEKTTDLSDVNALRTSIRSSGSATDTALATEAAIRSAIDSSVSDAEVVVDLGDDGTTDINPLQQISTTGDTNGIFSAGNETGELTVDVGAKWPDADKLDGVEGGSYARTDVNEKFSEEVIIDEETVANSVPELTASGNGKNTDWNKDYQHKIVGANNALTFTVPSDTNNREAAIQAGHSSGGFSDFPGDLYLNPVGGEIYMGGPVGFGGERAPSLAVDAAGDIRAQGTIRNDWTDLQNVNHSNLKEPQVGFYDSNNAEWINGFVSDLIRERGALSVGDVSFAATWRTIESDTEPTQRPNGDPLQEGDVWIDTDATPVAEAYVYRNGAFQKTATAIGGNNIVTDSIDADKITADTITANEIKAGTITAELVDTQQFFADQGTIDDFTASTAMIEDLTTEIFSSNNATIETKLSVGSNPSIDIDGSSTPKRIETSNFQSLSQGFRMEATGFAEFGDIRARGAIRSAVFERDEQVLRGGTDIVTPATTLAQDASSGDTTIEVEDVPFSAGDDVRFKEAGTTEIRTISSISGTTLTLNNGLASAKTSGAAIARWNAERIVHTADSQFAPFTSYYDSSGDEVIRQGRIGGLAAFDSDAFGLDVAGKLSYSTAEDLLRVEGQVNALSGVVGPYSINERGIASENVELFDSTQRLGFSAASTTITGILTNPELTGSSFPISGWTTPNGEFSASNTDDHLLPNDRVASVFQTADFTSVQGEVIDVEVRGQTAKRTGLIGDQLVRVELQNTNTSNTIYKQEKTLQQSTFFSEDFSTFIPTGINVSSLKLIVTVAFGEKSGAYLESVKTFGRPDRALYAKEGMQLFDDTGAQTVNIDRLTGGIEANTVDVSDVINLGTATGPTSPGSEPDIYVETGHSTTSNFESGVAANQIPVDDASPYQVGQVLKLDDGSAQEYKIISNIDIGTTADSDFITFETDVRAVDHRQAGTDVTAKTAYLEFPSGDRFRLTDKYLDTV